MAINLYFLHINLFRLSRTQILPSLETNVRYVLPFDRLARAVLQDLCAGTKSTYDSRVSLESYQCYSTVLNN